MEPTNWSQRGTKPGPPGCSGSAQAKLRFAHLQLRLKQQLLRSKDGNGNCSCRDSDVDFPATGAGSRLMHKCEGDSTVSVKAGCLEGFDLRGSKGKTAVHIEIKEAIVNILECAEAYKGEL
jgi:hypothetical protein